MRVKALTLTIPASTEKADAVSVKEPVKRGRLAYVVLEFPANAQEAKIQLLLGDRPIFPSSPEDEAIDYITLNGRCQWFRLDEPVDQSTELEFRGWNSGASEYIVNAVLSLFEDYR